MGHDRRNRRWPVGGRARPRSVRKAISNALNEPGSGASSEQLPILGPSPIGSWLMRTLAVLSIAAAVSVAHGQKPKPAPATAAAQSRRSASRRTDSAGAQSPDVRRAVRATPRRFARWASTSGSTRSFIRSASMIADRQSSCRSTRCSSMSTTRHRSRLQRRATAPAPGEEGSRRRHVDGQAGCAARSARAESAARRGRASDAAVRRRSAVGEAGAGGDERAAAQRSDGRLLGESLQRLRRQGSDAPLPRAATTAT